MIGKLALAFGAVLTAARVDPAARRSSSSSALAAHCTYICDPCGTDKHVAFAFVPAGQVDDPFACSLGGCFSGDCLMAMTDRDPVNEIVVAASEEVPSQLADVVREYSDLVSYNGTRGALQVRGCSGEVIAHIPMSAKRFDAIAELAGL
jgi:hypothetical protein